MSSDAPLVIVVEVVVVVVVVVDGSDDDDDDDDLSSICSHGLPNLSCAVARRWWLKCNEVVLDIK